MLDVEVVGGFVQEQLARFLGQGAGERAIRLAGAAERGSEHPLGQAVTAYARRAAPDGTLPDVTGFAALPGCGVRGNVDGRLVEVLAPDGLRCSAKRCQAVTASATSYPASVMAARTRGSRAWRIVRQVNIWSA